MIFDLHNDFPTAINPKSYAEYLKNNASDGSRITAAVWTSEFKHNALDRVKSITDRIERFAPTPIAIEDIGFLADRDEYTRFEFGKYLYCSLTWNDDNYFAGGALGDGGLTEKGRRAIEYMTNAGCTLDLAHLNKKSFYEALDCVNTAVCSHTGFNSHPRSLDESQIQTLVKRNGLIGLCTVIAFTDADSATKFALVVDGFVQKYGADNLALGTDFNGSIDIPRDLNSYECFETVRADLASRGYTQNDIDKILYKNAQKFFKIG